MGAPDQHQHVLLVAALRVAETRLTVYRSFPYRNFRRKKEQRPAHADALDQAELAIRDVYFINVLGNLHN